MPIDDMLIEAPADQPGDTANAAAADETAPTTKKPSRKKAAKKTAKKSAAKKSAKKTAKKKAKASKKTAKKTAVKQPDPAEPDSAEPDPADAEAEPVKKKRTRKTVSTRKAAAAAVDEDDALETDTDAAGAAAAAVADVIETIEPDPETEPPASADDAEREPRSKKKRSRRKRKPDAGDAPAEGPKGPKVEMVVNYVPGEDCRIAIVEDGRLEEFYAEPTERVSRVGNIYVGKVTNVESQIQAAFVDFGLKEAGFLHVSDLHPRYFPGGEGDSERVGRKTPRRERPPIQQCLKRGQEITVQVLKEGVGTKGPSLTSYLSVPGRYMVMMPEMDKVGVSRKVEDEEQRRQMRRILGELDLPDGFGFILRTAGFERTKDELDRDLAYLKRLWADMERRRKQGRGPRLLYAESDLLLRTLRDQLTSDVARIVIDSEHALRRAAAYLEIVSPGSRAALERYTGEVPIFHAFNIEPQLDLMLATEVPLPSGGRLIIEQTEALVAIDVNSGKSRGASDAEANAFNTNMEAVDEICRQLRLRDLGGLVINDLIDMRPAANRRKIEERFLERLKRDRAKSTIQPISQFGILEMTRQRMRGSYEQQHFHECPTCSGRGLVPRADSVAARALRELAVLLAHGKVAKAELVVAPRVAGSLLSTRRASLGRVERTSGKKVEVRISETMPTSRFNFYAYDPQGADIDIDRLPKLRSKPSTDPWKGEPAASEASDWAVDPGEEAETVTAEQDELAEAHAEARAAELVEAAPMPGVTDNGRAEESESEADGDGKRKRRRRRRRRRRDGEPDHAEAVGDGQGTAASPPSDMPDASEEMATSDDAPPSDESPDGAADEPSPAEEPGEGGERRKRRRRRRRRRRDDDQQEPAADAETPEHTRVDGEAEPKPDVAAEARSEAGPQASPEGGEPASKKRKRRTLFSGSRRSLSPSEVARIKPE